MLCPWGFVFAADEIHSSHCGLYSSGHYCRGTTRIGLSCRAAIDNLFYEHSFVRVNTFSNEIERFTLGHHSLMKALGHTEACQLVCGDKSPDVIVARDGGDRVAALIHDLSLLAAPFLREPCEEFNAIIRRGTRVYSVV